MKSQRIIVSTVHLWCAVGKRPVGAIGSAQRLGSAAGARCAVVRPLCRQFGTVSSVVAHCDHHARRRAVCLSALCDGSEAAEPRPARRSVGLEGGGRRRAQCTVDGSAETHEERRTQREGTQQDSTMSRDRRSRTASLRSRDPLRCVG